MAILIYDRPSEAKIREAIKGCTAWFARNPKRRDATVGMFFTTATGGLLIFRIRAAYIEQDVRAAAKDPNRALGKSPTEAQAKASENSKAHNDKFADPLKPRSGPTRKKK